VLTIIDIFLRFSRTIEPRFTFRAPDVVEIPENVGRHVGFPKVIRVDRQRVRLARSQLVGGATLGFSWPGKPLTNAFWPAPGLDDTRLS